MAEENNIIVSQEKKSNVEEAFKSLFSNTLFIKTVRVRVGNSSSKIHVPKIFEGHKATVIIWDE